jgi:hypothetical protein
MNNLSEFFRNQILVLLTLITCLFILTYKQYSILHISIGIVFIYLYSYFIHIFAHYFPHQINIHMLFHHNNKQNKYVSFIAEFILNILMFLFLYIIQNITNFHIVPNIVILYYGIIYVTIHNINYTIFHTSESHIIHHSSIENKTYNYGPDFLDHIFNTAYTNEYENYNHTLINIIVASLITYYIYKPSLF